MSGTVGSSHVYSFEDIFSANLRDADVQTGVTDWNAAALDILGGFADGTPFACQARVLKVTDGRFTMTGPMGAGNPGNLGHCALIDIDGVRVMVVSHKVQALDQAILRHVGVEPRACPIVVLKSSVPFRAGFGPIAERIIIGIVPGPVLADPAVFNFRYVRPDFRRRPRAA